MERNPTVYIMASGFHGTLYVGVTSNLLKRVAEHRDGLIEGFTTRYKINRLVWFDTCGTMEDAIAHEKRLKRWRRDWKYDLIAKENPTWRDLAEDLGFAPLRPLEQAVHAKHTSPDKLDQPSPSSRP